MQGLQVLQGPHQQLQGLRVQRVQPAQPGPHQQLRDLPDLLVM